MGRFFAAAGAFLVLVAAPALLALYLAATAGAGRVSLRAVSFSSLEGWKADEQSEAFYTFLKSCASLKSRAGAEIMQGSCHRAAEAEALVREHPSLARVFFEETFTPHLVRVGWKKKGLLTGYYEPLIEASLAPDPAYPYPLYARPADQVTVDLKDFRPELSGRLVGRIEGEKLVPYHDRSAIAGGALAGKGLEILWAKDPVDVFFLQIQGSGRAQLPGGSTLLVGYAGGNGHPYTSIGRVLMEMGALGKDEVSMFSIREWLAANPERLEEILNQNASYVFFRLAEGEGPVGSAGAVLTPMRSLAVDPAHVALGLPVWVETAIPDGRALRRLLIAQDTGGAIKGAMRGDLFFGFGEEAEGNAGRMKADAVFYVLLPREEP
ncbi:MAG TPA: MltA domain-containing protein [Sphingomonadales bacterium]|nr:MltA domain-containing protein [Sphingomonadales bacterium]